MDKIPKDFTSIKDNYYGKRIIYIYMNIIYHHYKDNPWEPHPGVNPIFIWLKGDLKMCAIKSPLS